MEAHGPFGVTAGSHIQVEGTSSNLERIDCNRILLQEDDVMDTCYCGIFGFPSPGEAPSPEVEVVDDEANENEQTKSSSTLILRRADVHANDDDDGQGKYPGISKTS